MTPATYVLSAAALISLGLFCRAAGPNEKDLSAKPFREALEDIRQQAQVPALAGAAWIDGRVVEIAATGFRKIGGKVPVTQDDLWHIGSCTKAMTATLAATLVDAGRIRWDSTVGEVLGKTKAILPEWKAVTLEQLLQHRGGAPEQPPADLWAVAWKQVGSPREQRRVFVQGLLSRPLQAPPGTKFLYSNQGYAIAGAMLEQVTNTPWERLMKERVFEPLGMKSAGFGPPGKAGKEDQPLAHRGQTSLTPVDVGPAADNPPAIGPAGTVHCSISDLVRYAGWHATGTVQGAPGLSLKPETFARLHQPPEGGDYAMGWGVTTRPWAGGTTLTHAGSNTMWLTVIWVAPEKHAAFVASTNCASASAPGACDTAVSQLIQRLLK